MVKQDPARPEHPMSVPLTDAAVPSHVLHVLDTALDQSHDVKAELVACADDLGSANDLAKARIADGATTLPAASALSNGLAVEQRMQDCADDLQQVTDNLTRGVNEVKAVELALSQSRMALVESEAALAASRDAERTATRLALHDQKTGLPNRTLFDDRLAQAIAGAERHGRSLAVMFLDLDRFKEINNAHGHAVGDAVLSAVAERLMRNARDEDSVCRNDGDEFLYLLSNPADREAVARIAALVRETIESPIELGDLQLVITPSIGIALYPDHGKSGPALIGQADAAMYQAKQLRSHCEFFEPAMASRRQGGMERSELSEPAGTPGGVIKAVVVDDDGFTRELLAQVLAGAGMQVASYDSAAALLGASDLSSATVLLLDLYMPGMSGLDLQNLLKQRGIDQPVVFISGTADMAMAVTAMRNGAADFIEKPFEAASLVERVRAAVARHADRVATSDRPVDPVVLAQFETLTPREREVFDLLVTGMSSKLIARELGGSFRTIEIHRAQVMRKMAARHLPELVRMSIESLAPRNSH